jgi:SWI/SNF-related matrix-associated actin-dependent regulator 1 of chromatin subfamily A
MKLTKDQIAGARFLSRSRIAMLADVPGLGKTAQVVRACDILDVRSATILVPNQTLAVNFAAEFEKWSLLGHHTHILRSSKDDIPKDGVLFVTYALASRPEVLKRLLKRRVDVLACDEAHALKSRDSARTKAVMRKAGLINVSERTWLMTGTPAPNNAGELYVFAKCCGAYAGAWTQFVERYCICSENAFGISIVGSKNHEELKGLLAPFFLRRTHVEGRPPLTIDKAYVEPAKGADPYAQLTPEDRASVERAIETGDWTLADIPAVATVRRLVGLAKADGVAELAASELEAGYKKLLIFCQHTSVIDRISALLDDAPIYDGRTPQKKREQIYREFQDTEGAGACGSRVLVCQMAAASEGLTLTKANRVLIAEPSWTPHNNEQAIARAWRKGQTSPVLASFVALKGSLDERITAALHRKSEDISRLV